MAVLSWLVLAVPVIAVPAAAGCYAPELRDCAVSCTAAADCAPGQVCGADAWCAEPSIAGQCSALSLVDAGASGDAPADAALPRVDAFVPPSDAPPAYALTIKIGGRGRVLVDGLGQCDHSAPGQTCSFPVALGVELVLTAIPLPDTQFDKWSGGPCAGQDETCQLIPILLTTFVEAKFRNGSDDD